MTQRNAIVVGAGIGGLAAAIALRRRGWQVRVFERTHEIAEVGAGISLWPNALRALDAIGVGDRVRALGALEAHGGIRHPGGRWLSRTDVTEVRRRYGPVVMLHRADLLRAMLDAVPHSALVTGAEVTAVDTSDDATVTIAHSGGTTRADLLVGADGIRSTVRDLVWPGASQLRYAGYTAWRMVIPAPPRLASQPDRSASLGGPSEQARPIQGGETWGSGAIFGYASLPDGRIYAYATATLAEGARLAHSDLTEVRRHFGGWHDPIPALLDAAGDVPILRHDIYHLSDLDGYVQGRVALLGDAAHAMTPNLGQGACQAVEDAATLAAVLDDGPDIPSALARYDRLRRHRTQSIGQRSRRIGAVPRWAWPPAVATRDVLLALIPGPVMLRSLAPVLDWRPPGTAG